MIEKALRWFVLAGCFAIPGLVFVVLPGTYFPYVTGKAFAFRILVEAITPPWILLLVIAPAYRPRFAGLLVVFGAFVAALGVSALLGVNSYRSVWGSYERMEGWVSFAHLLVLFVIMASVMNSTRAWTWFWIASVTVSLIVCAHSFGQALGLIALWGPPDIRISSMFGNPGYLGIYLMMNAFLTALVVARLSEAAGRFRVAIISLGAAVIAVQLATILLSGTRATIVGVAVGGLIAAGVLLVQAGWISVRWRRRDAVVAGVLVIAAVGAAVLLIPYLPAFARMSTFSVGEGPIRVRLLNWLLAGRGFLDRPLLGWGQENYRYVFEKFYDPVMYDQEFRVDRPHNVILEWLLSGGVIGLGLYMALFVVVLHLLFKSDRFGVGERSVLAGLFFAYLACNVFMFDNLASYVLFVAVLAYIHWGSTPPRRAPAQGYSLSRGATALAACGAALASGVLVYTLNADAARANLALAAALNANGAQALSLFSEALDYQSFGTEDIRRKLAATAVKTFQDPNVSPEVKEAFVERARRELDLQIAADPNYSAPYYMAGALLNGAKRFEEAEPYFVRAHALAPKDQAILIHYGLNAVGRQKPEEAARHYCAAYELDTSNPVTRVYCLGS